MGERADVLVVGASAAGLAATLAAVRAGARVTLLEARPEIGVPEAPAAVAFDFLWDASERPPADSVRRRLAGVRLRSPLAAERALDVAAPLWVLDRTKLDHHFARLARAAGARIVTGVEAAPQPDGSLVAPDGRRFEGRVRVFADGAQTRARAYFEPTRDPDALAWGVAHEVPAQGDDDFVTITPGSHAPGGRTQVVPLGPDRAWHWTFVRGSREDALAAARRAAGPDARFLGAAPDPVYTLPRRLVADGVVVAGGAAGQGGLEVGVASGEMAGQTAARCALAGKTRAADLRAYERAWMRRYLGGYRALRAASDRLARLSDAQVDRLLAPWAGWRVPVRDIVGIAHGPPLHRVEALAKFAARNPHAVPIAAALGLRSLLKGAAEGRTP